MPFQTNNYINLVHWKFNKHNFLLKAFLYWVKESMIKVQKFKVRFMALSSIKGSPENNGQVRFWSSIDPILQILIFFFRKILLFPKCYPKRYLFNTLCKKVGWDHLSYFSLVLTPYCKIHFKKSGNLKRPQILSN